MRIYAVADIHGKPDRIRRIGANVAALKPDVLVAAGDITQFRGAGRVLYALNRLSVPVLAVRGNSDRSYVESRLTRFPRIRWLHLRSVDFNGIRFTGVSGTALLPFRSKVRYRERKLFDNLAPLLKNAQVLVTHPPPWGVRDEAFGRFHVGCRRLRYAVDAHQPALVVFGHIHERAGTSTVGRSIAVNCTMGRGGGGAVIDWDGRQVKTVVFL